MSGYTFSSAQGLFVLDSKAERALRCLERNPCTSSFGTTYNIWLNSAGYVDAAKFICSRGDRQRMFAHCWSLLN